MMLGKARAYLLDMIVGDDDAEPEPPVELPRLTATAIRKTRMPRSRDKILANLEEMYREAFTKAKESGDEQQMQALDFAYRREQLYFEILLDIRDGRNA
jgi:hypothetical protein